jgi:hypothetical protein
MAEGHDAEMDADAAELEAGGVAGSNGQPVVPRPSAIPPDLRPCRTRDVLPVVHTRVSPGQAARDTLRV